MSSSHTLPTITSDESLTMASSFESINYGLRPNKAVERRLIFDTLIKLNHSLKFSDFQYIGLGALLFVDFVLAHHLLGITDLVSMEHEDNADRARQNAPFGCIKVLPGDSSVLLVNGSIDLEKKKTIAWMDYDGIVDKETITDIETLGTKLLPGSVIIVTVNAVRQNYFMDGDEGSKLSLGDSLYKIFGNLLPDPLPKHFNSMNGFPRVVTELILAHLKRVIQKSRTDQVGFVPLFNFIYKDGNSPMVTVGGLVADESAKNAVAALTESEAYRPTCTDPYELELPILTPRERFLVNQLLPSKSQLNAADVKKALGFNMRPSLVENYRKLYKFYPSFSEILHSA